MRIDVISIFPAYFSPLRLSLIGKAIEAGLISLAVHDLRDWASDRHRTVDDTPYGGGAGMVMRPDVWGEAIDAVLAGPPAPGTDTDESAPAAGAAPAQLIIPGPSGEVFTQELAASLATCPRLVFACGRYEGIDARVAEHYAARPDVAMREVSLGDYVLNGGEVAVLAMAEAIARLIPGVLGNPGSLAEESHGPDHLLEYPLYTKPASWRGLDVPDVLVSGNHGAIASWRREQAIARTRARRPDLAAGAEPV